MIYAIAIAVCLLDVNFHECDQVSARAWIVPPDQAASLSGCMMTGMQYAASSGIVTQGSYAKVFCRAGGAAGRLERAT